MALLFVAPLVQDVSATKTVFITTDNIVDHDFDVGFINAIKNYVQELSGGELQVVVDNEAPAPGEGYRSIAVTSDVSIDLAASDAGNYIQLANYSANSDKQIVFVNIGDYDLDNSSNYLRRAWDDNYTTESLLAFMTGTLLRNAGIFYVQPAKEYLTTITMAFWTNMMMKWQNRFHRKSSTSSTPTIMIQKSLVMIWL